MRYLLLMSVLALAALPAGAQSDRANPSAPPVVRRGAGDVPGMPNRAIGHVERGDPAPDFDLGARRGQHLSSLRGGWVAIVFEGRRDALARIDSLARALQDDHVLVIGVVAEGSKLLTDYALKAGTPAMLVSDLSMDIAALYGAFDPDRNAVMPGVVIVNPLGKVRSSIIGRRVSIDEAERFAQYASEGQ